MIDIVKAKQAFSEYVRNYNPEDLQIKLKISHIERVSKIARDLAKNLQLDEEDIKLAELIGLLHDIGRFEQIRLYHTFVDRKSINHGEFGVKLLFEDNLIRNFIEDSQYDNIIKNAILNHNRAKIEDGLNEREMLHAKIVRDSDKTDILYILTFDKTKTCYGVEDFTDQKFTNEVFRGFMEDKTINYANIENEADILIAHFAYIFDFNFEYGLNIVKNKEYLEKIYNRYEFKNKETADMYKNIYEEAKKYIEDKLKN
ncbi:MAG: HD domain-containing protein [Clostridia bacterium]|nr:HD domain-containing protein [Clostridia bacterium]